MVVAPLLKMLSIGGVSQCFLVFAEIHKGTSVLTKTGRQEIQAKGFTMFCPVTANDGVQNSILFSPTTADFEGLGIAVYGYVGLCMATYG